MGSKFGGKKSRSMSIHVARSRPYYRVSFSFAGKKCRESLVKNNEASN